MACNVFGSPITDETLEGMPEYVGTNITRNERALVAMSKKYVENKYDDALKYVKNLAKSWRTEACQLCTLCLIYNGTGDPVKYQHHRDWSGKMGPAPPFPVTIANGQWGAFLHVSTTLPDPTPTTATGSIAGIVYRGLNEDEKKCDWLLCWYNPSHFAADHNRVHEDVHIYTYSDVKEKDYFPDKWANIYESLSTAPPESRHSRIEESTTTPVFTGTMTLEGAA